MPVPDMFSRKKKKKKRRPVHVVAIKNLLTSLVGTGLTQKDLVLTTGLCKMTVSNYIATLHSGQHTFVYVSRYIRWNNRGCWSPIYCYGVDMPSLKHPAPKSRNHRRHLIPNWVQVKSPKGIYYEHREPGHSEIGTTIERSY